MHANALHLEPAKSERSFGCPKEQKPWEELHAQSATMAQSNVEEDEMGFFGRVFSGLTGVKSDKKQTGDMRKATGAGPALAAHSKDAKTSAATGQNPPAARKRRQ